jgi:Flp pilus assembly protein TadG
MTSRLTSVVWVPRSLRRFRRDRRGSAAVEFALVAPVFFALLFAILETGIMFFAGQVLQTVAQDSARMILTGQAQTASYTTSQFATYVCSKVPALFTCSNISIDVKSFPSFSAVTISNPIDNSGNFISANLQYSTGGPGDIVVLRLFYQWPQIVTGLGWNPSNLAGNKRLLVGTAAFKNEPY